jgi:hypothetical protein
VTDLDAPLSAEQAQAQFVAVAVTLSTRHKLSRAQAAGSKVPQKQAIGTVKTLQSGVPSRNMDVRVSA